MTMGEYRRKKKDPKVFGAFTISVAKHKMEHKGPVNVSVSSKNMEYLEMYVNDIRGRLEDIGTKDSDLVFTTYQGTGMSTSLIGTCKIFKNHFLVVFRLIFRIHFPGSNRKRTAASIFLENLSHTDY